jgi:hypothetical protein
MIDHAVKKILSYELIDFICKNTHIVLGTDVVSYVAQHDNTKLELQTELSKKIHILMWQIFMG